MAILTTPRALSSVECGHYPGSARAGVGGYPPPPTVHLPDDFGGRTRATELTGGITQDRYSQIKAANVSRERRCLQSGYSKQQGACI